MRAPEFWRRARSPLARALSPLAALYGAAAAARMARKGACAELPVIVVGGLTLGGDGKTPAVLALAALLAEAGERPAILTRGYGRRRGGAAPFLVDPDRHGAAEAGDEALLLARRAPTIVGIDRAAAARMARAIGATALLLDDGFHSRRLETDLAILVVDGDYGAGNGFCPPAGPLRAPLGAQLAAADALLAIGEGAAGAAVVARAAALGKPVFRAGLEPVLTEPLAGRRALAFAGIGRPEKFFVTLEEAGVALAGTRAFPDHHSFSAREIAALEREAARLEAGLITTEKDAARLSPGARARVAVLPVALVIEERESLRAVLRRALARD